MTSQSARNLFSGFWRKHLFITTCIEKQCTRFKMANRF